MKPDFFTLGLIGYPLEKSLSPDLHQAALGAASLQGEYRLYPILPLPAGQGDLQAIIRELHLGTLHGLNVTIPHKQNVLPYLDRLTPGAAAIQAANTLVLEQGRLVGDNTDIPGFLTDLRRLVPEMMGHALVLGAGGSARAVVHSLAQTGWRITIASRRPEQAAELLENLGLTETGNPIPLRAESLRPLTALDLVVNTTPVGMLPFPDASLWPEGLPLPQRAAVYDLIYKPLETRLLRQAREAGLPAFNGLGMLVEQAALAFERWTGANADRKAMWAAVSDS